MDMFRNSFFFNCHASFKSNGCVKLVEGKDMDIANWGGSKRWVCFYQRGYLLLANATLQLVVGLDATSF